MKTILVTLIAEKSLSVLAAVVMGTIYNVMIR